MTTPEQEYTPDTQELESVALMADLLILKGAREVIKSRIVPGRELAASVADIECQLMASEISAELWQKYRVVAS